MSTDRTVTAIAFDAYGTLFDVYAIGALAEEMFAGKGAQLAEVWRVAQIDYTRIRALSGRYRDFWAITGDALDFAAQKIRIRMDAGQRKALMAQYARLDAFPENADVLRALKGRGLRLAILSNGTDDMLASAVAAAGMSGLFAHVLSVDSAKTFKTAPQAYQLGPNAFGCEANEIVFVSSNGWDVCGATWFGYRTFWVNRAGNVLDNLGVRPHGEGKSLADLPGFVDTLK